MVCKKEVIAWFRDLSAYRRIDFLCALMDCCGPLELRFLGAYVEELGRKDFDSLRESELNANDISYLSNLTNISDIRILDKVLTSLALMNSKCQEGARVLFRTLKDHTNTILNGGRSRDPQPETHEKVVLLAVMALNHPAFTFSQKQALRTQLSALLQAVEGQASDEVVNRPTDDNLEVAPAVVTDSPLIQIDGEVDTSSQCAMIVPLPPSMPSNTSLTIELNRPKQESVYIKNIEVKGLKKRPADKRYEYTFQVHWSNGTVSSVSKTHAQLFDFQCKLLNLFPEEASDQPQDRVIPYLPGKHIFSTAHKGELAEKTLPEIVEYAKQLSALPQHILECEHTVNFFQPPPDPTTGAPVYTNTAQPSQLTQTQATMPKQQQESKQHSRSSSSSPHTSPRDASNLADPAPQMAQQEQNQLQHQQQQQHAEQVQQLQQQSIAVEQLQQQQHHQQQQPQHVQGLQGASTLTPQQVQQQQNQASHSLSTSLSQMLISHHHPVNVSTPTPTPPTMTAPVSCLHTSMVTTTAVTTTAGVANTQYYPAAVNNMASMPGSPQPSAVPSPQSAPTVLNNTEQYNTSAAGSNDQVPGLQQYKLPGTRLPYKPNSWPIYSQPNVAPPSHTAASPFVLPSPHMCVSGLHSPRYFPMVPHYPPPRDVVVPPIQEWLKKQRLHKYAYLFEGMTVQQVLQLTDEEIDSWSIVTGAKGRIKTQLQTLRNGYNGITPQAISLVATSIAGTGTSGTIPSGGQQQQQQQHQAFMTQLQHQAAGLAVAASYATGMPPGVMYSHPLSSGEGTGSECSSTPSSPRESSDENDRDSEGSESSVMSSPEARPVITKETADLKAASQPPIPLDRNTSKRMGQGSPRPPLANLPYMVQSPTGEVIPLALAVAGRAENLMMQPPPPPGRQMDVRLPGIQVTPDGSSPVLEMTSQQPQQKGGGNGSGSHLSMPTSSTISMVPRHQAPIMSMSDSSVGMPNMASAVPPGTPSMDLAAHMMHMKGSNAKSTLPSPQYTPVEEPAYKTSVVLSGVHTTGSVPVLSNSVASMQMANARTDNGMANHMINAQGMLDHSGGRTLGYAPSTSQPNFVVNPIQAHTAVTYVTTTSQSHTVAMPNNTFDTATSMPFNNNQSAYPSVSNNSALCTSCGCSGQCAGTSGAHHAPTPHFPPFGGAYLPNQLAFHNFSPNFYHQGNVGNVLPPTPTNNVMNSPMPAPTGTPASPRYPSPMPPSPFQNAMPGEMPPYGGGNAGFPGLVPPAVYLGAMGLATAGQRTNHIPSSHQMAAQANPKKPPPITCYNCGARGHRQSECQEATMEAITQNSQYRLNFKPLPEQNDNNDS